MEQSQASYIFDPESAAEMARLIDQDRHATTLMGGVFAGLASSDVEPLQTVLDVACGPGGWVLDVAFAHPTIDVAGIDISKTMIDYANARARSQRLTNASFGIMDIVQPLDFSDAAFDLVNARFLFSVLRREQWEPLLSECTRILRPGGILRLTEPVDLSNTSSPAHHECIRLFTRLLWRLGYGLSPDECSIDSTFMFPYLLRKAGYQAVRYQPHFTEISAGSDNWADAYHNFILALEMAKPMIVTMGLVSQEEFERLYAQALSEMMREDFCGVGHLATVWGKRASS